MNDPRITSYALGELAGSERDQFERELAASETLQRELNETIQLAEALGNLPMPTETLTDEARAALRGECAKNLKTKHFPLRRILIVVGSLAAVACLFAMLSLPAITGALTKADPEKIAAMRVERERKVAELESAQIAATTSAPSVASNESAKPASPAEQPIADFKANIAMLESAGSGARTPGADWDDLYMFRGVNVLGKEQVPANAQVVRNEKGEAEGYIQYGAPVATPAPAQDAQFLSQTTASVVTGDRSRGAQSISGNVPLAGQLFRSDGEAKAAAIAAPSAETRSGQVATTQVIREFQYPSESAPKNVRSGHNTEAYDAIQENVFLLAKDNPLSTFSIDVDTASYANVRRFLQGDQVPPAGAIRTEELINYFTYDYPQPGGDVPFSVNLEVSRAPWDAGRELVRIGLKGREIPASERGPANLVFLVDVSGSMDEPDKLPLLKRSLQALVENLSPKDRVAIAVYAGSSGLVLPSTPGTDKARILATLENLQAGGSTNGGAGIRLAYNIARENFLKEGNNRVILCTDGDFNVGTTSQSQLVRLIEKERDSGVFLSVLGFGTGNLKDSTMEKLADKGNGNYGYIDSFTEGRKVLVEQMGATLFTIAKDVKIQVEFNPARVAGYRLIGYENRLLAKEDFNDDKKDAGEIGAGHTVTALYEIIPAGQPLPDRPSVDPLKYQPAATPNAERSTLNAQVSPSTELLTVKLRYKAPDGDKSKLIEVPLTAPEIPAFEQASSDFRLAAAAAAFGMKLRGSPTAGDIGWNDIQKIVRETLGNDPGSYRAEFLTLIEKASKLKPGGRTPEE